MRATGQRLAGLEHDDRQSRLAMEIDVPSNKKSCKRSEDAAADRMMSGDSSSAQVDPDLMCLTSSGAIVDKDAAAPKSCLSPVTCAR